MPPQPIECDELVDVVANVHNVANSLYTPRLNLHPAPAIARTKELHPLWPRNSSEYASALALSALLTFPG